MRMEKLTTSRAHRIQRVVCWRITSTWLRMFRNASIFTVNHLVVWTTFALRFRWRKETTRNFWRSSPRFAVFWLYRVSNIFLQLSTFYLWIFLLLFVLRWCSFCKPWSIAMIRKHVYAEIWVDIEVRLTHNLMCYQFLIFFFLHLGFFHWFLVCSIFFYMRL